MMTNRFIEILLIIISLPTLLKGQNFYRSPSEHDSAFIVAHSEMIKADPAEGTITNYYRLAEALWNSQRMNEAKGMFIKIVEARHPKLNETYSHSSDVQGDTTVSSSGYGSFTSSYKNSACLYLTKICIEQKKFSEALHYLIAADKKYVVKYYCGTGHGTYQRQLSKLYGLCYEGMGQVDKAIDVLIPYCLEWESESIIRILKEKYTSEELKKLMDKAINSITCKVDSGETWSYVTVNYGTDKEERKKLTYTSGSGTIDLFGKTLPLLKPNLENGEIINKQHFIDQFMATSFYQRLTEDYLRSNFKIE